MVAVSVKFHSLSYATVRQTPADLAGVMQKNTASPTIHSVSLPKVPASTAVTGLENTNPF